MLSTSLLLVALACSCLGFFFTCCCSSCTFASDSFDRADNANIDTGSSAGWTEVSGTWDIVSNQLKCSSAGIALCNTSHPDGKPNIQVTVDIDHDTSGSTVDIIVGYVTSANYYYARFTFDSLGGGTIEIRKNFGGTHSSQSAVVTGTGFLVPGSGPYSALVCASDKSIFASIVGSGNFVASTSTFTLTGTQVALSCSGSGNAIFDNFAVAKSYESSGAPNCPRCQPACVYCESTDVVPSAIQAVVGSGPYAGTYLCDLFVPVYTLHNTCDWVGASINFCTPSAPATPTVAMSTSGISGTWRFRPGGGVTFGPTSAAVHTGAGGQLFFDDCTVPPTGMTTTTTHNAGCPTPLGSETCDLTGIT